MNRCFRLPGAALTKSQWSVPALAIAMGGLVIAWPMPGVIALRNGLVGVLFLALLVDSRLRDGLKKTFRADQRLFLIYCAFLCWAFAVAILVNPEPHSALNSMRAQWLVPTIVLAIGSSFGYFDLSGASRRWIWLGVTVALFAHPILHILFAIWLALFAGGIPPEYAGLMDHRANITYVNLIAAAFVVGDMVLRAVSLRPIFPSMCVSMILFMVIVVSSLLAATRNGVLSLMAVVVVAGAIGLFASRLAFRFKMLIVVGLCVALGAYGWAAIQIDTRWDRFLQTVPVALNVDHERAWINTNNQPLPLAPDGKPVEITAYERIAWTCVGVRLALEHPLGTGLGGDAFKILVRQNFGEPRAAHSHNGYIDLALDVGLPGLVLLVAFFGGLAWIGLKAAFTRGASYGVVLTLVVFGYGARAFLDNIFRVHIAEELFFFVGFVAGLQCAQLSNE